MLHNRENENFFQTYGNSPFSVLTNGNAALMNPLFSLQVGLPNKGDSLFAPGRADGRGEREYWALLEALFCISRFVNYGEIISPATDS